LANRTVDLLIWSVAVEPDLQGKGIGTQLLKFAEARAIETRLPWVRLYTASQLSKNVSWYQRLGYVIERHEQLPDRTLVHMAKRLGPAA
jgi:ribosomal protein S18 acetylase RimI-like enzyme